MNVKAIMCDIDGTLLSSEGVVTKKTVEMIKKSREKGILFGLSTGRDVNSIQTLLGTWGIEGLVDMIVGTGGAEIYDYTFDISKAQYPLDGELIKEIVKHYEDMDCNFAIPEDGIFYSPKDDEYIQDLSKGDRVPYKVVDYDEYLTSPKAKLIIICIWIKSLKDLKHFIVMIINHHHLKQRVYCTNTWIQEYQKLQDLKKY